MVTKDKRFNYVAYIVFKDSMYSTVFTTFLISTVFVKNMITHFNKHSRGCYAKPLFGEYMVSILLLRPVQSNGKTSN